MHLKHGNLLLKTLAASKIFSCSAYVLDPTHTAHTCAPIFAVSDCSTALCAAGDTVPCE